MGVIWRGLKWLAGFGLLVLLLTIAAVLYFSVSNLAAYGEGRGLEGPVDAIIVLGGGIDGDGVLGYSSRRRVAAAVELLSAGRTRFLILAGGRDPGRPFPPAGELMRRHALALGAPAEALIVENRSVSTLENLRFALALAEERRLARLALLTDAFHLERARWLARWLGAGDIGLVAADGLAHDDIAHRTWSILREALAWWLNLAKVAAWQTMALLGIEEETRAALVR